MSRNAGFFALLGVMWLLGLAWLGWLGRADAFLALRRGGIPAADLFFRYLTHLGDGLFAIALVVLLLLRRRFAFAFVLLFGYAVSGLAVQALKHSVAEWRPAPFFSQRGIAIHAVEGVPLLQSATSFPSGHTATAFAIATALVLMSSNCQRRWPLILLLTVLIGYSRIYLGQHFVQDVLAGSLLGVLASVGGYALLCRWQPSFLVKER